jgi:transcriptional regulator of acetoin/glycerol metabolism
MKHSLGRAERNLTLTDAAIRSLLAYRWPGNVRELLNVLEQLVWLSPTGVVDVEHLPPALRSSPQLLAPRPDRRRQAADELYDALVKQRASFWEYVYPMFLARDIARHDLRELVRRGLQESKGRYKSMLTLFGMPSTDYRRFMNFLAAHECSVAVKEFRREGPASETPADMPPPFIEPPAFAPGPMVASH